MPGAPWSCCCCPALACALCSDVGLPETYGVKFYGVSFDTSCWDVTNNGQTSSARYFDRGFDAAGYCAVHGTGPDLGGDVQVAFADACVDDASWDDFTTGNGPRAKTFTGAGCGGAGFGPGQNSNAIRLRRDAGGVLLEVISSVESFTIPGWEPDFAPVLWFQGTLTGDDVCYHQFRIDNGITSAGVLPSEYYLDYNGNAPNAAAIGVGGYAIVTPCCETGI